MAMVDLMEVDDGGRIWEMGRKALAGALCFQQQGGRCLYGARPAPAKTWRGRAQPLGDPTEQAAAGALQLARHGWDEAGPRDGHSTCRDGKDARMVGHGGGRRQQHNWARRPWCDSSGRSRERPIGRGSGEQ
jgi:hypothetical protein